MPPRIADLQQCADPRPHEKHHWFKYEKRGKKSYVRGEAVNDIVKRYYRCNGVTNGIRQ